MSDVPVSTAAPANDAPQPISEQKAQAVSNSDPKLDMYARKERALLKQRKEIEDMRKAFEAERANYLPKSRFKEDPIGALADVDLDYQKLTETVLNQPNANDPTIRALFNELKAVKQQLAQQQEVEKTREAQTAEQGRKQLLSDVRALTKTSADYELIEKWGAHEAVLELMEESFSDEAGTVMELAEAAKKVEEQLLNEALKVYESNKIKERLNAKPVDPASPPAQASEAAPTEKPKWKNPSGYVVQDSARNRTNTLTNRLAQDTPRAASSEQDRRARAIAAIKGELK